LSILDCESRIANVCVGTHSCPKRDEDRSRKRATSAKLRHWGSQFGKAETGWRSYYSPTGIRALLRRGESAFMR